MGFDSLFERGIVALEKIAEALHKAEVAEVVAQAESPRRGRKAKENVDATNKDAITAVATTPAETAAITAAATAPAAQRSFLDDEDEPAEVEGKQLTEAEHRAEIRRQMLELQKKLDPDRALSILVKHGKAQTLKALKPENFQAMYAAIAEAMPK